MSVRVKRVRDVNKREECELVGGQAFYMSRMTRNPRNHVAPLMGGVAYSEIRAM